MNKILIPSVLFFLLLLLSCGDSAVSMMDPDVGNTLSAPVDDPGHVELCHNNMRTIGGAIWMFYGMTNRYPDSLSELEIVEPGLCSLTCPSCDLVYLYDLSGNGDVWTITCPIPVDPNHGYMVNGQSSWPPDPPAWPGICHSNMTSLASACAMFYGSENRYPEELSELGTSGIYEFWDNPCPACGALYNYSTDLYVTYTIQCPMPTDPTHGYVIDGVCSWPPGSGGGIEGCRSNMRSLGSACAMFYGSENRYPVHLKELEIEGIMENWDLVCPDCGELYLYYSDSPCTTYVIQCPLPDDPCHGSIEDGVVSWI